MKIAEKTVLITGANRGVGKALAKEACTDSDQGEQDKRNGGFIDEVSAPIHITICGSAEDAVEPPEESSQGSAGRFLWP